MLITFMQFLLKNKRFFYTRIINQNKKQCQIPKNLILADSTTHASRKANPVLGCHPVFITGSGAEG